MLLVGAGLLLRTSAHVRGLEPGFDGRGVMAASVSLQDAAFFISLAALAAFLPASRILRLDPATTLRAE